MVNYLNRVHPNIKIEYDSTTDEWHLYWKDSWNKIIVGTKNAREAPQILLHEISHALIEDNVEWINELQNSIKALNNKYGKQLFSVSNSKEYNTKDEKAIEDVCELIALYARWDTAFDKYMDYLQSEKNNKLAKISKSDAKNLKDLCENIISWLNTVKLFKSNPVSKVA